MAGSGKELPRVQICFMVVEVIRIATVFLPLSPATSLALPLSSSSAYLPWSSFASLRLCVRVFFYLHARRNATSE